MNADDRIMIAKCFLFSIKVLFAILYTITDRADKTLYEDYRDLADDLKRWYSPDASASGATAPPPDAESIKARGGLNPGFCTTSALAKFSAKRKKDGLYER